MMLLITEKFQMTPIYFVDIINTKSDSSESEHSSVSKIRISHLNAEMSDISDVLIYFAVRDFELVCIICQKFWYL